MKLIGTRLKTLFLFVAVLVVLVACERPVPGSETPESSEPTPTVVLPTLAPTVDTSQQQPTPEQPTPVDGSYPAPVEGEATPTQPAPVEGSGNTQPEQPAPGSQTSYVVQSGDTLFKIARQFGLTVNELAAANGITNANILAVGQTLKIPAPGSTTTTPPTPGSGQQGERIHVVQAGENLFRIGLKYGFTVDELARHNNIANPNSIEVGQQIRIPAQ